MPNDYEYDNEYEHEYYGEYDDGDVVTYKEWQERSESLVEERRQNYAADDDTDKWVAAQERENAENLLIAVEQERYYREEARKAYGAEADEGHDDRIEKVRGMEQILKNHLAHADGEYEYARPMQEVDEDEREELEAPYARRWPAELEAEYGRGQSTNEGEDDDNSDMDLESDDDYE